MTPRGFGLGLPRRSVLAGASALSLSARGVRAAARTRFVTANNNPYDILDPHAVLDIGRIAIRLNMYDALLRWVDNPPRLDRLDRGQMDHLAGRPELHVLAPPWREVPRRHAAHGR